MKPKAILFFTDYCKNLIFGKGRWVNPETFNNGHYILNGTDIPVIFCEDITTMSGRSIDNLVDVVRNSLTMNQSDDVSRSSLNREHEPVSTLK